MHVQQFPIEIRGISRTLRPLNNNSSGATGGAQVTTEGQGDTSAPNATGTTTDGAFNNPNVEVIMEVTPESITIDSLGTTLVGSNATGDSEFL